MHSRSRPTRRSGFAYIFGTGMESVAATNQNPWADNVSDARLRKKAIMFANVADGRNRIRLKCRICFTRHTILIPPNRWLLALRFLAVSLLFFFLLLLLVWPCHIATSALSGEPSGFHIKEMLLFFSFNCDTVKNGQSSSFSLPFYFIFSFSMGGKTIFKWW